MKLRKKYINFGEKMKRNKINPIFTVINHYRPISDNEKLVERYHGRTPKKGRVDGRDLLVNFLDSLNQSAEFDYETLIVDNASDTIIDEFDIALTHNYISLKDDKFGLTRAWNMAASFGYLNGNDFIVVCNDDITFNSSINNLFDTIEKSGYPSEDTLWGVVSDSGTSYHYSTKLEDGIKDVTDSNNHPVDGGLHGWFYAFHRDYFKKYNIDGKLFDETWKWSGGERFQHNHRLRGGKQCVVLSTLVKHDNGGSWRHNRDGCKL
jgi:hypothetical protein